MSDRRNPFICTPATPWQAGMPTPVVHTQAQEIACRDGYPGGDIATMRCANCGHEWTMELPQ